ncbi:MAG: signal peptide peptidase SppA, partial [bacterium]|nr:signal peptide peptidase SppA [bacterium]
YAENDDTVKGVILRINSPGGTVGMSQRLYSAVMHVREKKPVIAVLDDIAASGGYYVASAADRIVALEGTMTGSIGVIMSTTDAHELLTNKLGISQNVIKSGKYKDIGSSTRAMTKEERQLLQEMVNDSYQQFKSTITNGRIKRNDKYEVAKTNLTTQNLNKYADGRIFTGRQAKKLGFVDSTGGNREAKEMMIKILEKKGFTKDIIDFVDYGKSNNFLSSLGLNQKTSVIDGLMPASVKYARKPLYLWE